MTAKKKATGKKTAKAKAVAKARKAAAPPVDRRLTPADGLTDEIRVDITQRLAMYDTPSDVVKAVNDEYALTISRQQAQHYDPTVGRAPAKKWADLFHATRAEFLEEKATIPAAQRAVRVRRLGRMADKAEERGNMVLAAALYEQIAKETGDLYTNRHKLEHAGVNGAPLTGVTVEVHNDDGSTTVEVIR